MWLMTETMLRKPNHIVDPCCRRISSPEPGVWESTRVRLNWEKMVNGGGTRRDGFCSVTICETLCSRGKTRLLQRGFRC